VIFGTYATLQSPMSVYGFGVYDASAGGSLLVSNTINPQVIPVRDGGLCLRALSISLE
jgi:hypothetical protein